MKTGDANKEPADTAPVQEALAELRLAMPPLEGMGDSFVIYNAATRIKALEHELAALSSAAQIQEREPGCLQNAAENFLNRMQEQPSTVPAEAGGSNGPDAGFIGTQFTCPECGSHYWGTSHLDKDHDKWVGHCHGNGCKFTWMRRDDDKYFAAPLQSADKGKP